MNFLADSLVAGIVVLLGGSVALLATLLKNRKALKALEAIATISLVLLLGLSAAGLDALISWPFYLEMCLAISALLIAIALVRYGHKELAEGEYD